MHRLRLGVLFGGACEEHPISVKSAREVAMHLDDEKYEVTWIGITRSGRWTLCEGPSPDWECGYRPVVLSPDASAPGLIILDADGSQRRPLDVVLPVLHGRYGEDGAIQGLLELSGVPYVGCAVASSAVCMDKSLAYALAAQAGIATPPHRVLAATDAIDPAALDYPVFVKPARSGSSFGVTKVSRADDLRTAIAVARSYDPKVLIEDAVCGSEIGCAVLGERFGVITGELDRVHLAGGFFRIHQEDSPETGSENATFIVPADIDDKARRRVVDTAKVIYRALGCAGLARVDMFLTDTGVVLNEVNTMPGLTSYSRYPRMMAAAGLSLGEVLDRLISLATSGASR